MSITKLLEFYPLLPFVGILLSIAIIPMMKPHWWVRNLNLVAGFWSLAFLVPLIINSGFANATHKILHIVLLDYIPFMILLLTLFVITGGIVVRGKLHGGAGVNTVLLGIGTLLASCVGTTGASVLMIRPILRANAWRKANMHVVIFFIFLVSNIGGVLTPVGDPPLFLGFLHGVPFFWTLRLAPIFLLAVVILLAIFYVIDRFYLKREVTVPVAGESRSITVLGKRNYGYLLGVLFAIVLSGMLREHPWFYDQGVHCARGLSIAMGGNNLLLPWLNLLRDGAIFLMLLLSWFTTGRDVHAENNFSWAPIEEVAYLFACIFITIVPVIETLETHGAHLGIDTPAKFFWVTGVLSSFLDNAPTYLTFLSAAGGFFKAQPALLGLNPVVTDLGAVSAKFLIAISAGAVFMGANSYIGNAPNFLVKSIAEENGYKVPSFFGYMLWSGCILLPLFGLITWMFF